MSLGLALGQAVRERRERGGDEEDCTPGSLKIMAIPKRMKRLGIGFGRLVILIKTVSTTKDPVWTTRAVDLFVCSMRHDARRVDPCKVGTGF